MKFTTLLALGFLALSTSCHGMPNHPVKNNDRHSKSIPVTLGDTVAALGNNIMILYQDTKNIYWFGSHENGLYRYDGKTMLHYTTKDGLPHNRINEIREDKHGNLYFNTSGGLSKFDGNHFLTLQPSKAPGDWNLNTDDLWFISPDFSGYVLRVEGEMLYKLQVPKIEIGEDWDSRQPGNSSPYAVYTTYKDTKGNVWFGTAVLGALRYNGELFEWITEEDVTELHNGPSNGVRSIIEDRDGYFWFNSMYRYKVYATTPPLNNEPTEQPFYSREKSIGNLDGQPDSDFWEYMSAVRDNNQGLWIATYGNGVWHYNGKNTRYYRVQADGKDITLFSIYKDNHGDLWLGTHENGAYKFNGSKFERFELEK